jgi:hypothetical protein
LLNICSLLRGLGLPHPFPFRLRLWNLVLCRYCTCSILDILAFAGCRGKKPHWSSKTGKQLYTKKQRDRRNCMLINVYSPLHACLSNPKFRSAWLFYSTNLPLSCNANDDADVLYNTLIRRRPPPMVKEWPCKARSMQNETLHLQTRYRSCLRQLPRPCHR